MPGSATLPFQQEFSKGTGGRKRMKEVAGSAGMIEHCSSIKGLIKIWGLWALDF